MNGFTRAKKSNCPCFGCTDRVADPNCHSTCERHLAWKKKQQAKNEAERQERERNFTMSEDKKRILWRRRRYGSMARYQKMNGFE